MSTKSKKASRVSKRRLAIPASLIKNIEDARKNLKTYQNKGVKEVEKLYNKVIEIDFVKKVRKNEIVKRAAKAGNEISKEFETRLRKVSKEIEDLVENFRGLIPIPTRSEVEKLARKVSELSRKLDEISGEEKQAASN